MVALVAVTAKGGNAPPNPNKPGNPGAQPANPAVSFQKPDLSVDSLQVSSTQPNPGGGTQVTVSWTMRNKGPVDTSLRPTAAGKKAWHDIPVTVSFFSCVLDMREYPNEKFPPLEMGEPDFRLGAFQSQTWKGTRVVPAGKRVEFRVTVDPLNWIDESDETNNSATLIWPVAPMSAPATTKK